MDYSVLDNNNNELQFWIALHHLHGFGAQKTKLLTQQNIHPSEIFSGNNRSLHNSLKLNASTRDAIRDFDWRCVEQDLYWREAQNHHIISINDAEYPALLREIYDPPTVIYVAGNARVLHSAQIAIVGSRNPSHNGAETAFEFAKALANTGLIITSGLALGIDTQAHRGALAANSGTIAVMGCGLDTIYPKRNSVLAQQILEQGTLVSEFAPHIKPVANNFPRRNRIISGLSVGTLVVEAARQSGSLITARLAMEQGREVFAIPGSLHNPLARGCHALIRDGAKLVETIDDILNELTSFLATPTALSAPTFTQIPNSNNQLNSLNKIENDGLRTELKNLLECIGYEPVNTDILVERSLLTPEAISSMLIELELSGYIKSFGGMYVRQ